MNALLRPSIHWLFVFIPVAVVREQLHAPPPLTSLAAALAIVPIARLIVIVTGNPNSAVGLPGTPGELHHLHLHPQQN